MVVCAPATAFVAEASIPASVALVMIVFAVVAGAGSPAAVLVASAKEGVLKLLVDSD
jgi:hypothetical protein